MMIMIMEPECSLPYSQELSNCIYPEPDQSRHHHTIWPLQDSTHLCFGLSSGLIPSGFPTYNLYEFLFFPICATCPSHLILLDLIFHITLGEECRPWISSLCSFLHPPRFQFSAQRPVFKRPRLRSFLNVRDQVSHPCRMPNVFTTRLL
jgi:hypothetical protein